MCGAIITRPPMRIFSARSLAGHRHSRRSSATKKNSRALPLHYAADGQQKFHNSAPSSIQSVSWSRSPALSIPTSFSTSPVAWPTFARALLSRKLLCARSSLRASWLRRLSQNVMQLERLARLDVNLRDTRSCPFPRCRMFVKWIRHMGFGNLGVECGGWHARGGAFVLIFVLSWLRCRPCADETYKLHVLFPIPHINVIIKSGL